jgi:hypothetical protein
MQQNLFPSPPKENNKTGLDAGLEIEITKGIKPKAKLYRTGTFIKIVDLSDKVAKRLFIVETVELGANQSKLAEAINVSRQTIHNYRAAYKEFGKEGLINRSQKSITGCQADMPVFLYT